MKKRPFGLVETCRKALPIVVTLLVSLLVSCHRGKPQIHDGDDRLARIDSMMGKISDVDSLEALAQQSHEQNDKQAEMLALNHKGIRLRRLSRFTESIDAHNRGLQLAESQDDTIGLVMMLSSLGEDYRRLGEFSKATGYYFKSLKLCDDFSDQNHEAIIRTVALTLNGLGNIEMELCDYAIADSVLREALKREQMLGNNVGIAVNYSALGRIKHDLGELDSAWYYQRKSMEYNELGGNEKGVALCHLHSGELHEAENRFSHAVEEYRIAYDKLKETGDTWHWLDACLALARVSILLGEVETARGYIDEAEAESYRIGSKEYQAETHMIHYELSLLQGDAQEALQQYVRGTELQDSIYGRQKSEEMRAERNRYQTGRMSDELDVLNRDLNNLKRTRNMQIAFTLLVLLMAGAIILALMYAMRVRVRTQRLMRQVEETRSLFFTNVVHQLRTPLSAIMGSIDAIIAEGKEADNAYLATQRENCEIIERQGNNLLELVDRILEVGSVRSAITDLDWSTGDLVTFMHMVIDSYHDRCVERHIELTYASRESSVEVDLVPRYVVTIMSSLLENAISYTPDYGKITVTTSVEDGQIILRVADNGMGIGKDDLPHVFEPFYRSAIAESMVEGVGIGLTVVRDMTMALGGTIAADSMKDHGSVFTVKLPCRHPRGVKQRLEDGMASLLLGKRRHEHQAPSTKLIPDQPARDGAPTVLVVEDHTDVARLVGLVLGNSYQVHYATDGEQGLAKAAELEPDLIITDVKMPLKDGVELCRQVRNTPRLCHIPVIILSARNADADRVRGIRAGADAYLVKPFVREELLTWVENLLENRRLLRETFSAAAVPQPATASQQAANSIGSEDAEAFLDEFAREVEKQFSEGPKVDLDKVARHFKMGEIQLRRKIQTLTGKNVLAHISQLRMEKAMTLLQNSPDTVLIGDIALKCGFQDVAYFSRVFRQHYGMTPTQARHSHG